MTSTDQTVVPLPELPEELLRNTVSGRCTWSDSRRHPRSPANFDSVLVAQSSYSQNGHQSRSQAIKLRDISRAGMRILHPEQLFPGERCSVTLPNATNLKLEVCWCRRVAPGVFMSGCCYAR